MLSLVPLGPQGRLKFPAGRTSDWDTSLSDEHLMTEPKNKPSTGADEAGSGSRTITGARLATGTEAEEGQSATQASTDEGTRLRIVTVAPGTNSFPDIEAPSRDRRDPYVGSIIDGRYKVETVLGEGGMGVVYRCSHTIIGKKLALKVLRADLARDGEVTERFLNEAKSASAIGNPHIIDISDFGQLPDGSTYFVMEYLMGQSLTGAIDVGQSMPLPRIVKVGRQLGEALAAAHAAGIVHRDLKPDNIFLIERGSEKDFVKILDFGIAKVSSSEGKLTRAGAVFGTPHYMSPEQAAGMQVDHRGDIYSLGIILYELAAGRTPFDADNFMGVLTQHMYKAPPSLREMAPNPAEISEGLEAIVAKCLAKRPELRYQSMHELVADLDRLGAGTTPGAALGGKKAELASPAQYYGESGDDGASPPKGRGALVVVLICLIALAGGGALYTLMQKKPAPPAPAAEVAAPKVAPPRPQAPEARPGAVLRQVLIATEPVAQIFRGTDDLGMSPVSVDVAAGETVELSIRAEGYKDARVILDDGSEPRQSIRLEKVASAGSKSRPKPATAAPKAPSKPAPKRPSVGGGEIIDPWSK
jgi:eukaryotic-like serine/threonine-protein kinase